MDTYHDLDMNFTKLFAISKERSCFILQKVNGEYELKEIDSREYVKVRNSLYN